MDDIYILKREQINPPADMGTLRVKGYDKAVRLGEEWLEDKEDSWDPVAAAYAGPDYFYTVTALGAVNK